MIKSLKIHNFGPLRKVDITPENKNVYIVGPNGSGKSHILRAISLALTGKHDRPIKIEDFIGPYNTDFKITVTLDNGSIIERTNKTHTLDLPNGQSYKKTSDVLEHLPFDPTLFFNVSFIKQGKITEVLERDIGKGIVEKLVSLVIDNKILSEGYTQLVAKEKEAKAAIKSYDAIVNEMKKTDYDQKIIEIQQELFNLQKSINRTVNEEEIKDQKGVYNLLAIKEDRLYEAKKNLDSLNKVEKPTMTLRELEENQHNQRYCEDLKNKIALIENCLNINKDALSDLSALQTFFSLDTSLIKGSFTKEQLLNITSKKEELYSYLLTEAYTKEPNATELLNFYKEFGHIDSEAISKEKAKYESIRDVVQKHIEVIKILKQNNATKDTIERIILTEIRNIEKQKQDLVDMLNKAPSFVNMSNQEVGYMMDHIEKYNRVAALEETCIKEIKELEEAIPKVKLRIKMTKEEIAQAELVLSNLSQTEYLIQTKKTLLQHMLDSKTKLAENETALGEADNKYNTVMYWKNILKELPGKLRNNLLQPVAYHLNKDFQEIFSFTLGEIKVDWSTMDIVIGERLLGQLSGAQEVALGLILHLSLLKAMGEQVPVMLIDEPTQFMDNTHINEVKMYLNYLGTQTQMWICTHEDAIMDSTNAIVINTTEVNH